MYATISTKPILTAAKFTLREFSEACLFGLESNILLRGETSGGISQFCSNVLLILHMNNHPAIKPATNSVSTATQGVSSES